MGKVAVTVKKQLGPHLKTLLPYWLAARFDPSREVARAAYLALWTILFIIRKKKKRLSNYSQTNSNNVRMLFTFDAYCVIVG
jgi:hypothetical protein